MPAKQASYKKLFTYWFAVIIYDLTVKFTEEHIRSYKLRDQMDGAARSGKQNIVEGSDRLRTSFKTAIRLTDVAKASLEELIGDYEDFLRQRNLEIWGKSDQRVKKIRDYSSFLVRNLSNLGEFEREPKLPKGQEAAANTLLTLCHQATYLLSKQVDALENKHLKEGGYSEKLYKRRKNYLNEKY